MRRLFDTSFPPTDDFDESIEIMRQVAISDYAMWCDNRERSEFLNDDYFKKALNEFDENLVVNTRGKKYVKLISGTGVWGFVVKEDDDKFKRGDILKAASWNAPAKNKARGNIFEEYDVQWTGPLYL